MKRYLFKILILILTIFCLILIIDISFAIMGKVNDSNIRVRSGPSIEGTETLTNLYLNDPVEIIEELDEWYKIKLEDGQIGYIFAEYVNVSGETNKTEEKKKKQIEEKTEVVEEEIIEEEFIILKIKEDVSGKYMPLMYSSEKVIFKAKEDLKILDEKAFWSKVSNDKVEAWVLSNNLIVE